LLATLIAPFAPHIAEELWERLGEKKSVFLSAWPEYDPDLARDEEFEMVIQINGRVRDKIIVSAGLSEDEAKRLALESEKIKQWISSGKIKKIIFTGKLVNIVM
jgi:leucyl-tRNA synthetase